MNAFITLRKPLALLMLALFMVCIFAVPANAQGGHLVAFDPDDGNAEYPDFHKEQVEHGGTVSKPNDPQRPGYTFAGWATHFDDETGAPYLWDFDHQITDEVLPDGENMTLWAVWEEKRIEKETADTSDDDTQPLPYYAPYDLDSVPETGDDSMAYEIILATLILLPALILTK